VQHYSKDGERLSFIHLGSAILQLLLMRAVLPQLSQLTTRLQLALTMGRPLASSRPVVRPTVLRPQTTSISVVLPVTGKETTDICHPDTG